MKSLLFIVVLSLLAVGYARDQEEELAIRSQYEYKGDHTKKGSEGYSHGKILMVKCSEMARNTTNTFSLITNSNVSFIL